MTRLEAFREAFRRASASLRPRRHRWPVNGHVAPVPYRLYRTAHEATVARVVA